MSGFLDLLAFRRRQAPRVTIDCMVDIELPGTHRYTGFFARDLSVQGIRLEGGDPDQVRRLLSPEGRAHICLRLPGVRPPLPRVEAELRWGMGDAPRFCTGWRFTDIEAQTRQLIESYIDAHPQDLLA